MIRQLFFKSLRQQLKINEKLKQQIVSLEKRIEDKELEEYSFYRKRLTYYEEMHSSMHKELENTLKLLEDLQNRHNKLIIEGAEAALKGKKDD